MTAAPDLIPPPLIQQLKKGGKMVIPALPEAQQLMPGEIAPGAVQIKLIVGLHWNAACGRPLNSLRDRVRVSEVVLVALPERFGISGRYLLYVMAERT